MAISWFSDFNGKKFHNDDDDEIHPPTRIRTEAPSSSDSTKLLHLSNEILERIGGFLKPSELAQFSATCRRTRDLFSKDTNLHSILFSGPDHQEGRLLRYLFSYDLRSNAANLYPEHELAFLDSEHIRDIARKEKDFVVTDFKDLSPNVLSLKQSINKFTEENDFISLAQFTKRIPEAYEFIKFVVNRDLVRDSQNPSLITLRFFVAFKEAIDSIQGEDALETTVDLITRAAASLPQQEGVIFNPYDRTLFSYAIGIAAEAQKNDIVRGLLTHPLFLHLYPPGLAGFDRCEAIFDILDRITWEGLFNAENIIQSITSNLIDEEHRGLVYFSTMNDNWRMLEILLSSPVVQASMRSEDIENFLTFSIIKNERNNFFKIFINTELFNRLTNEAINNLFQLAYERSNWELVESLINSSKVGEINSNNLSLIAAQRTLFNPRLGFKISKILLSRATSSCSIM